MDALTNLIREAQLLSQHRDKAFGAAAAPRPGGVNNLLMSFPIGAQVLDLVTGLQGVVINGQRENVIIPTSSNTGG